MAAENAQQQTQDGAQLSDLPQPGNGEADPAQPAEPEAKAPAPLPLGEEQTSPAPLPEAAPAAKPVEVNAPAAEALQVADDGLQCQLAETPDHAINQVITNYVDPAWDQVNTAMISPVCRKCGMVTTVDRVVNKSKGEPRNHVVCKGCNASTTMLSRRLGAWPVPAFQNLSQEQQISFWKSCNEVIQRQGKLDYASIRALLAMKLEERQLEVAKSKFTSEFLPVSVWVQRGFDADDVKKGECEQHPMLGPTYAVPLKTVSKAYIKEKIESMLLTFEGQVRKRKADNALPSSGAKTLKLEDGDEDGLTAVEWIPTRSPAKKKGDEDQADADDTGLVDPGSATATAKQKRQAENQLRRHNVATQKLAQRGIDVLTPLLSAVVKHQANKALLPSQTADELATCADDVGQLIFECQEACKVIPSGDRVRDLPFDAKSLAAKVKDCKALFSQCDRMVKLFSKAKGLK
eukprot:Skav202492  [mRNA]  locus=scaffold32:15236:16621:+ [translate_table: standard]